MNDEDEFLDLVGSDPRHMWFCRRVVFEDEGEDIICSSILTSQEALQTTSACHGCQHRFTRCVCVEPAFEGHEPVCYGDDDKCPYGAFKDPHKQHMSMDQLFKGVAKQRANRSWAEKMKREGRLKPFDPKDLPT